jgi:hypothetical protein
MKMELSLGVNPRIVDFEFIIPPECAKIGVYVSGGLDSAALLCLILSELKATNRLNSVIVECFTAMKQDGSTYYSKRVIEKVSEHFNVSITHNNNISNDGIEAGQVGTQLITKLGEDNSGMTFYMGLNKMVHPLIKRFKHRLKIDYGPNERTRYYTAPFLHLQKPQILDIFFKLGCDAIIPFTHTCTTQIIGRCNDCYSCEERSWGFEVLGKDEPDTVTPDMPDVTYNNTWINPAG